MIDKIEQPDTNWFMGKNFRIGLNNDDLNELSKEIISTMLNSMDQILDLIDDQESRKLAMILFMGRSIIAAEAAITEHAEEGLIKINDHTKFQEIIGNLEKELAIKLPIKLIKMIRGEIDEHHRRN